MKTLRVLWVGFLALFARKAQEDPIARLERIVKVAKTSNAATLSFHDPQLGEVRLAMYQTVSQASLDTGKRQSPEEVLRQSIRVMAPGFERVPLPKGSPNAPPQEEAGFDG